jgi:uncharacterized membrane protein
MRTAMRWVLALFYLTAGYVHLSMPNTFMPVMPDWVPAPYQIILFTGVCEVAGAIGLIVPRTRWLAGLMLALYAIAVFPVNIKHAIYGPAIPGIANMWLYHGPRLLLQPVLVWWALYAGGVTDWPFRRVSTFRRDF